MIVTTAGNKIKKMINAYKLKNETKMTMYILVYAENYTSMHKIK